MYLRLYNTCMIKRIGFACKWIDNIDQLNKLSDKDDAKKYNTGTTTVAWLDRQSETTANDKLWSLVKQNIESCRLLVARVGQLEDALRMVRLSSDVLPMYTHERWGRFYQDNVVRDYCSRHFAEIGRIARERNVRLSFHPGQFTVLASENPGIVERSIAEFEYHVDMARWMGYGSQFQDFKINVHISGKQGPEGIRRALRRMTPEARNMITIENDEMTWGLDASLELVDDCALVLDLHHHFINTGEYISSKDDRIQEIQASWRGVRPVIHYSMSREDVLVGHSDIELPDLELLEESGFSRQKLRAHSDFMWNKTVNQWALTHNTWADIMVECKSKNLGARKLYEQSLQV